MQHARDNVFFLNVFLFKLAEVASRYNVIGPCGVVSIALRLVFFKWLEFMRRAEVLVLYKGLHCLNSRVSGA